MKFRVVLLGEGGYVTPKAVCLSSVRIAQNRATVLLLTNLLGKFIKLAVHPSNNRKDRMMYLIYSNAIGEIL